MERFWKTAWWLAMALVTAGSLLPGSAAPSVSISDKLVHFTAYLVLSVIPAWRFEAAWAWKACLAAICLGVAIEFGQLYVPGRSFELLDMAANAAGAASGIVAGAWFRAYLRNRAVKLNRMAG